MMAASLGSSQSRQMDFFRDLLMSA